MKKTILILALGIISSNLISCNKEKTTSATTEAEVLEPSLEVDSTLQTSTPKANPQADLIAKAKQSPLTNVALSQKHYDFKDVKKGEVVEHQYEITNTGTNPLIISEVKPGCGCTAPNYTKDPILPGKSGFVTLKFDSSSFEGIQNKTAAVYANVEELPITLSFTANVVK